MTFTRIMLFRIALAALLYTYTQDSFFLKLSDAAVDLTHQQSAV